MVKQLQVKVQNANSSEDYKNLSRNILNGSITPAKHEPLSSQMNLTSNLAQFTPQIQATPKLSLSGPITDL